MQKGVIGSARLASQEVDGGGEEIKGQALG